MWSDFETPWQEAILLAIEALRAGSYGIGAVMTDGSGTIVSTVRNRVFEGAPYAGDVRGSLVAHAELTAIADLPTGIDRREVTLFTTMEPCPMCSGAVALCGVKAVRYAARDPYLGCAHLLNNELLKRKGIKATGAETSELENLCLGIFFCSLLKNREPGEEHPLTHLFSPTAPHGVELAMKLRSSPDAFSMSSTLIEATMRSQSS